MIFWAIRHPSGTILATTIGYWRNTVVAKFTFNSATNVAHKFPMTPRSLHPDQREKWKELRKQGYRAVKVKVTPA